MLLACLQVQQRIWKYLKDCERDEALGHMKILTNVSTQQHSLFSSALTPLADCYVVDASFVIGRSARNSLKITLHVDDSTNINELNDHERHR